MPTLRLIYLPEQYAGVTEDETNNNTTAAAELPNTRTRSSIHDEESRFPIHADDATRNASSNDKEPPAVGGVKMEQQEQSDDHEEGDDYLDTLLQEAIDAVNRRDCNFGTSHAVQHQQDPQEEMVFSEEEEIDNDPLSSVNLDTIQQKSGNKRKRRAPSKSVDDRLNDLMAFKTKYGHCNVSVTGEDASLGQWCSVLRGSYKKMQNNQKPKSKLSDEQIQRLNDAGFKWCLKVRSAFDKRLNDLMSFKAKHGHCNVSKNGEDASLGIWCSELRGSYKKMKNNQKPRTKLSDEQIQRLNDAGFKWSLQNRELTSMKMFDERFNDLMAFKAKYGHCDVSTLGEDASLGIWCSELRGSYKKIKKNQKPKSKLSDEQIQRLSDAGFKWSLQRDLKTFDERLNDLMAFKAKHGHCNVSQCGEDASLGIWCNKVRVSYKKMQNNQKPTMKLSDEQIQRLNDVGFKWCG